MIKEIWKNIEGYEGHYSVSNLGNVKSLSRTFLRKGNIVKLKERILSIVISKKGYCEVKLCKDSKPKTHPLHRLIANAFIEKVEGKTHINHIDGNKLNNSLSNLEWCNHTENMRHAYSIGLIKRIKGVGNKINKPIINKKTGKVYYALEEVQRETNIPYNTLRSYLLGNRRNKTDFIYK